MAPRTPALTGTALLVAGLLSGCLDHDPAKPEGLKVRLALTADIQSGQRVTVTASYIRQQGEPVQLAQATFGVEGPGSQDLPFEVDIAPCLADPQRAITTVPGACPLVATARLFDALSNLVDEAAVGPLEVAPGSSVAPQPLRLHAAAVIELVSGGNQVGWVGRPLFEPLVVRMIDRMGAPIAGRAVNVVTQEGGGAGVGGAVITGADGTASIGYALGPVTGTQRFGFTSTMGTSSPLVTATAVRVPSRSVAASIRTSCATRPQGTACWGMNSLGALGNPAVAVDTGLPVPVVTAPAFASVAGSVANNINSHAMCGLTSSGQLWCWGVNEQGMLGTPTSGNAACSATPNGPTTCQAVPSAIGGLPTIRTFSVGGGPTSYGVRVCAVSEAGDGWCWGENTTGATGDGSTSTNGTPRQVTGGRRWVALGTGDAATCGVDNHGSVYCWGRGNSGELGNGTNSSSTTPVAIQSAERFQDAGVGTGFACGLTLAGEIHCWGRDPAVSGSGPFLPRPLSTTLRFVQMSVGLTIVCGVTTGNEVWCAGSGSFGGLGDGTTNASSTFVRAVLPSSALHAAAGNLHACAALQNAEIYCWGQGASGALGVGPRTGSARPMRVNFAGAPPGTVATVEPYYTSALAPVARGSSLLGAQLRIRAMDAGGFPVPGAAITWTTSAGGAVVPGTGFITASDGTAAAQVWQTSATPGINTLTATATAAPGAPSATFTVEGRLPGSAARMACVIPCTPSSGSVGTLVFNGLATVRITDSDGLAVAGIPVTITGNGIGVRTNPVLPVTINTDANGDASIFNWRRDTLVRADTITFSAGVLQGSPVLVSAVGVPLAASKLVATFPPPPQVAGFPFSPGPKVAVTDQYSNVITTASGTVTLQGGPDLGGTLTASVVNGVADFPHVVPQVPGSYVIVASLPGLTSATTALQASGVRVVPSPVTIAAGVSMQLTANVTALTPATVFWNAANPAVASVSPTGVLTGVTTGATSVSATSTVDARAAHSAPVTVLPLPPTAAITAVTIAGTPTPVTLGNVTGAIDVTVSIAPNGHPLAAWVPMLDAQAAAAGLPPTGPFTARINTDEIIPATGKLKYCNGPRLLSAILHVNGGPTYSNAGIVLTLNNPGTC